MNWDYDKRPGSYKPVSYHTHGKITDGGRTKSDWQVALQGHISDAHAGKVLRTCPACRELKARVA